MAQNWTELATFQKITLLVDKDCPSKQEGDVSKTKESLCPISSDDGLTPSRIGCVQDTDPPPLSGAGFLIATPQSFG